MFLSSFASISQTQSDTDHIMTQVIIHSSVTEETQVQYQIRSGRTCRGESDPETVTLPRIAFFPLLTSFPGFIWFGIGTGDGIF